LVSASRTGRRVCARCGQTGRQLVIDDRRFKRWRHLDPGSTRCVVECELRLFRCPECRIVRVEPVPWARAGAHHTRDFEDIVAWPAQQMAETPIAGLLRIGWDTVGRIVSAQTTSTTTGSAGWSRSAATRSATAAD
jgi:transposase